MNSLKPFAATLLLLVAAAPLSSQCNPGMLIWHQTQCSCSGQFVNRAACQGSEGGGCDPLGGPLKNCGGGCYYINASNDFCGAAPAARSTLGAHTASTSNLAKARAATFYAKKEPARSGDCPADSVETFRNWLRKSLPRT